MASQHGVAACGWSAGRVLRSPWLGVVGFLVACGAAPDPAGLPASGPERTAMLYARHCAVCHGATGAADGPASGYLFPAPRDFGAGRFRLVSTSNGAPTDADLVGALERGMPGAAMPSFAWLPGDDLLALARHVRTLAVDGMTRTLVARYTAAGRELTADEARDVARWRLEPGDVLPVPDVPEPAGADVLERGRALFVARCAACHGVDGRGQQPDRAWAAFEGLYWARDLRAGLLKGGASSTDLAHRVLAGMPGVAMPPARFDDPHDAAALVAFVRSLLPPDAETRGVQKRRQLTGARVAAVPVAADDPGWAAADGVDVTLMPLAFRADCVCRVRVEALHDGARVAFRLSWNDPTRDDRVIGGASRWADQCALQFATDSLPPLFGMGGHDDPVDIWHWAAFRPRDVEGALDLLHGGRVADLVDLAPGLVAPAESADDVAARGLDARRVTEGVIEARPQWDDGVWRVVFVRALAPPRGGGIALEPGVPLQLACAIWNGSAEDHGARKSVSIWQELVLAR